LDLSNCCLTRVPPVLARLPRLTNLTLNENDSLGASAAALAPLSTLTNLRVGGRRAGFCRVAALRLHADQTETEQGRADGAVMA
jgi:hypothetical protein